MWEGQGEVWDGCVPGNLKYGNWFMKPHGFSY